MTINYCQPYFPTPPLESHPQDTCVSSNKIHHQRKTLKSCRAMILYSVLLHMKLAVLGQNWEENHCFRQQICSELMDDIHGLKLINFMVQELPFKKGYP